MTVRTISVDALILDARAQPRTKLDLLVVGEYAEAMRNGAEFPAVVAFGTKEAAYLADGWHRVHAAREADVGSIAVELRPGDLRDAILYSVGTNAAHGLRRTNADKQRAVSTLLRDDEWGKWSDSEIARQAQVDQKTVTRWREILTASSEIPKIDERTVRRGDQVYTQKTENIGRATSGTLYSSRAFESARKPATHRAPDPDFQDDYVEDSGQDPESQGGSVCGRCGERIDGQHDCEMDNDPPVAESDAGMVDNLGLLEGLEEDDERPAAVADVIFTCLTCGEVFDAQVWHCPTCHHHWLLQDQECKNCHAAAGAAPEGTGDSAIVDARPPIAYTPLSPEQRAALPAPHPIRIPVYAASEADTSDQASQEQQSEREPTVGDLIRDGFELPPRSNPLTKAWYAASAAGPFWRLDPDEIVAAREPREVHRSLDILRRSIAMAQRILEAAERAEGRSRLEVVR